MFERMANSWRLFGATLDVLAKDKELLVFPMLSGIAGAAVLVTFAGGLFGIGAFDPWLQAAQQGGDAQFVLERDWPLLVGGFLYYFVNFFAMTYFTAALVGAAHVRLSGGDPTIGTGLAAANRVLPALCVYALISATVGLILKVLEGRSRNNWIGRLAVSLIGMAWTMITYLVVPVLVIERPGAIPSIQRSSALLRQTWGEQILANFGMGLIGFLFSLLGVLIIVGGMFIGGQFGNQAMFNATFIAIGLAIIYWVLLGIVMSALRGIYTAALYGFATHQQVRGFPVELLSGAFRAR